MLLSERYFRPKAIELDGRLYEWLGVVRFKRLLMSLVRVDAEKPTANAYVLGGRSVADVRSYEKRSRRSEVMHLSGLSVATVLLAFAAWTGSLEVLVAGILVFAANFHCFILQRYNRIRIARVLGRSRRSTHGT